MTDLEWKKFLIPYSKTVEELKVKFKAIRKEYNELGEYSPIEFVTGRVKKTPSIQSKAKAKSIPIRNAGDFIDDIAGIRIMCKFTDDIYKIVELIHKMEEVDFKIAYERDYVKYGKKSGYKSYHVIVRYPVQTMYGIKNVLAEIQIRTLAMNFWSTIEHSINYKYNGNVPPQLQERLRKAASAAYALDSEMRTIRDEVTSSEVMYPIM